MSCNCYQIDLWNGRFIGFQVKLNCFALSFILLYLIFCRAYLSSHHYDETSAQKTNTEKGSNKQSKNKTRIKIRVKNGGKKQRFFCSNVIIHLLDPKTVAQWIYHWHRNISDKLDSSALYFFYCRDLIAMAQIHSFNFSQIKLKYQQKNSRSWLTLAVNVKHQQPKYLSSFDGCWWADEKQILRMNNDKMLEKGNLGS